MQDILSPKRCRPSAAERRRARQPSREPESTLSSNRTRRPLRLRLSIALSTGVAALLLFAGCASLDIQGHRGACGLAPENTMAAFRVALAAGVDTIESDMGVTRDGVIVMAHDSRLNPNLVRDAGGRWVDAPGSTIRSLSFAQLRAFDVGRLRPGSDYARQWAQQQPADGERFPSLTELFELKRLAPEIATACLTIEVGTAGTARLGRERCVSPGRCVRDPVYKITTGSPQVSQQSRHTPAMGS